MRVSLANNVDNEDENKGITPMSAAAYMAAGTGPKITVHPHHARKASITRSPSPKTQLCGPVPDPLTFPIYHPQHKKWIPLILLYIQFQIPWLTVAGVEIPPDHRPEGIQDGLFFLFYWRQRFLSLIAE